jgi:hypothetical protein
MTFVTLPRIVLRYLAAEDAAAGLLNALGTFCSGVRPEKISMRSADRRDSPSQHLH